MDVIVEDPEDVPVLLEDPPALALVVSSSGHVATVGNFTFALTSHTISKLLSGGPAGDRASRRLALTYRTLAARPRSFLVNVLVVPP